MFHISPHHSVRLCVAVWQPGACCHLDVRDFRSPRHLADRLRALMTHDVDQYAEMLRRKRRLTCSTDEPSHAVLFQTRLCRYLDATEGGTRTTDLELSWNARTMCATPRTFYRGVADTLAH